MKESYVEGLAAHNGPKSCLDDPQGRGEALTGVRTGRVFSRESSFPPGRRRCRNKRKATLDASPSRDAFRSRAVKDPRHVRKHLAREPGDPMFTVLDGRNGRIGKSKDTRR